MPDKTLTEVFTDIADAIREKTGSAEPISPLNFATEISSIEGGGLEGLETLILNKDGSWNISWDQSIFASYIEAPDHSRVLLGLSAYATSIDLTVNNYKYLLFNAGKGLDDRSTVTLPDNAIFGGHEYYAYHPYTSWGKASIFVPSTILPENLFTSLENLYCECDGYTGVYKVNNCCYGIYGDSEFADLTTSTYSKSSPNYITYKSKLVPVRLQDKPSDNKTFPQWVNGQPTYIYINPDRFEVRDTTIDADAVNLPSFNDGYDFQGIPVNTLWRITDTVFGWTSDFVMDDYTFGDTTVVVVNYNITTVWDASSDSLEFTIPSNALLCHDNMSYFNFLDIPNHPYLSFNAYGPTFIPQCWGRGERNPSYHINETEIVIEGEHAVMESALRAFFDHHPDPLNAYFEPCAEEYEYATLNCSQKDLIYMFSAYADWGSYMYASSYQGYGEHSPGWFNLPIFRLQHGSFESSVTVDGSDVSRCFGWISTITPTLVFDDIDTLPHVDYCPLTKNFCIVMHSADKVPVACDSPFANELEGDVMSDVFERYIYITKQWPNDAGVTADDLTTITPYVYTLDDFRQYGEAWVQFFDDVYVGVSGVRPWVYIRNSGSDELRKVSLWRIRKLIIDGSSSGGYSS